LAKPRFVHSATELDQEEFMLSRSLVVVALATLAVLGSARTSSATSFVESSYGLHFGCGGPGNPCRSVDNISNMCPFCFGFTTDTGLLSFSDTFYFGTLFTSFTVQVQSSYGSLHASADASYSRSATAPDGRIAYAASLYREIMTVNSPTQQGQSGFVTHTFSLDGTIADGGSGNALAYVILQAGTASDPEAFGEQVFVFESSFVGSVQLTVPITYGQEFLFTAGLGAFAGSVTLCPACTPLGVAPYPATGTGSGSANFFSSLILTGLTPTTGAGAFVGDAQFTGESGTAYGYNGVVPEPGSLILLGTGLAMGARRWRRRQKA
jgi:hypothetical protein